MSVRRPFVFWLEKGRFVSTVQNVSKHVPEIEEAVIQKIRERRDRGRKKYGTTMERDDLSNVQWLIHAQEEAMDLAIYLERLIRDSVK